ncbi:MAG: hypothetical protein HY235_29030 [Acidobacteria bacterium]|nr:hypothetical protein [Acidobacteriota bacterium]
MQKPAIAHVILVAIAGLIVLGAALAHWENHDPQLYASYVAMALVASVLKVKLPGLTGTVSGGFVFVLAAIASLSWHETVVLAGASALVQCLWKPKKRPTVVQAVFNVCCLSLSAWLSYFGAHLVVQDTSGKSILLLLLVSVVLLFTINTLLVSLVVSLMEGKGLPGVWRLCHFWSFPYYLIGAVVAGVVSLAGSTAGWLLALILLPLLYLIHVYYRAYVERFG